MAGRLTRISAFRMRLALLILAGLLVIAATRHLTAQTHYRVAEQEHRDPHLKAEACARDGIDPKSEICRKAEGDHRVPLCAGGPDELDNIDIQPCDAWLVRNGVPECRAGEAWRKDLVEWHWCDAIRAAERKEDPAKVEALRRSAAEYFTNHKRCRPATEGCW